MPLKERIETYKKIEAARNRPLVAYVTSSRPGAPGMMAADMVAPLFDQLDALPVGNEKIDLLLVSQGGDATVAWRVMSLLRERFKHVAVLVPQMAFSAATLLALGADEIVMHPHGNLGPVDPQVRGARPPKNGDGQGRPITFSYEQMLHLFQFARDELGVKSEENIAGLFRAYMEDVGPTSVGLAAEAGQLAMSMGEKLLRMHMKDPDDEAKAKHIAQQLNKKFFNHGYPVSKTEAGQLGLKVAKNATETENLAWTVWKDLEAEMQTRIPFSPILELAKNPAAAAALFAPPLQINLPVNLPLQLLQPLLQQMLANQVAITPVPTVSYTLIHAVLESVRAASRCITEGDVFATRTLDMLIKAQVVPRNTQWTPSPLPLP